MCVMPSLPFQLEKLSDRQSQTKSQLKFIIEAWLQVILKFIDLHMEFPYLISENAFHDHAEFIDYRSFYEMHC